MRHLSLCVYREWGRWPELKMEDFCRNWRLPTAFMTVNLKREREV